MSESKLWAVTAKGNVFTLSTKGTQWHQVPNQQHCLRGFKQVSVSPQGAWGLGCDHQIYVYVEASDVPIRVQDFTLENERWLPTRGWSGNHLIPLDPYKWSGRDGTVYQPKEDFKLPSNSWEWEDEWYVDENVKGHLTYKGGWRYGKLDFSGEFSHQKSFNSCIRKRRWIRHRRYAAVDRWNKIPNIHLDPLEEPIIDLAVGGHDIPHQKQGHVSVWVVTIDGRVLYRNGVHQQCPEGQNWQHIPTGSEQREILSIGVGPTGLVWMVTWHGTLLVRTEVSWKNVKGKDWQEVEAPEGLDDRVVQVAAGVNSVWVTTTSGQVWMRKGVYANSDSISSKGAAGTGWLKMVHTMKTVFVGAMDQVWGIDREERRMYFRRGVTHEEPTGRAWASIELPYSHFPDGSVLGDTDFLSLSEEPSLISRESSCAFSMNESDSLAEDTASQHSNMDQSGCETLGSQTVSAKSNGSGDTSNNLVTNVTTNTVESSDNKEEDSTSSAAKEKASLLPDSTRISKHSSYNSAYSEDTVDFVWDYNEDKPDLNSTSDKDSKETLEGKPKEKSQGVPSQSVSYKVDSASSSTGASTTLEFKTKTREKQEDLQAANPDDTPGPSSDDETDASIGGSPQPPDSLDVDSGSHLCESEEEDYVVDLTESPNEEGQLQWQWLSATKCVIQHDSMIQQWFNASSLLAKPSQTNQYQQQLACSNWRNSVLKLLSCRKHHEMSPYISEYELAVEKSLWTKKGEMKWWRDVHRPPKWVDCQVELTQDTTDKSQTHGTFCIQYRLKKQHKFEQVELSNIVCVMPLVKESHNTIFGVFTEERLKAYPRLSALRLMTSTEEIMEDWISALTVACCDQRGLKGAPQPGSLWGLTDRGDVMVHERDFLSQYTTYNTATMFWHQQGGHMAKIETNILGITWAIGYSGAAFVYTGGYGGGYFQGVNSSPSGLHSQTDTRTVHLYQNQRWRFARGYTDRVFLVDHYMWSDESGKEERTKEGTKLHSKHWQWTGDWVVDRTLPSGVDKEGWQYGYKLTGKFYSRPRMRCYLRRRKWIRKYKVTTVGPWREVGPLTLRDISIQLDPSGNDPVAVWAIGGNGDVLSRVGVTISDHGGQAWHHVPTDTPFVSISVGCNNRVWATAKDGSAWFRNGVTAQQPTGTCWFQVPPPDGIHLTQISVGLTDVYAVDSNKNLWFRKDITITFPEGTQWVKVTSKVTQVSVGLNNQVWTIMNCIPSRNGPLEGVVCRRTGVTNVTASDPKAGTWERGIGGGWCYVTARGWVN